MPSPTQFHIFLSAVSAEFRNERAQLENWLERKGLHVSSQEKFNQGDSTLWPSLHDEVARSQAVICVIGAEPGWPSGWRVTKGGAGTVLDSVGILARLGQATLVARGEPRSMCSSPPIWTNGSRRRVMMQQATPTDSMLSTCNRRILRHQADEQALRNIYKFGRSHKTMPHARFADDPTEQAEQLALWVIGFAV